MKVSTRGRYALRLMLDLAMHDTGEYIKIRQVAQRQEVSEKYLEQIITILNKAGFVRSARGARGGYRLAHPAKDYTVGMILRVTEGSLAPVGCVEEGGEECTRIGKCATLMVWKRLNEAVNSVVDNITLEDIMEEERHLKGNDYVI